MDEATRLDLITRDIIRAAIAVHRALGPGLLESAYEACLSYELTSAGHKVERQKAIPVIYRDVELDCGYRLDLLVDDEVIVEIKTLESLLSVHTAQVLSHLRLSKKRVGLLTNFNVQMLKRGIQRVVNDFPGPKAHSATSSL